MEVKVSVEVNLEVMLAKRASINRNIPGSISNGNSLVALIGHVRHNVTLEE